MIKKAVTQTTKQIAKKAARQIIQEPLEILKTAGAQISGQEQAKPQERGENVSDNSQKPSSQETELKRQTDAQKMRRMEAFKKELEDIQGIEEQKKAQKRQQEEIQKQQEEVQAEKPVPQISAKRGRRLAGMLGQIKKFAGLIGKERVKPPSG